MQKYSYCGLFDISSKIFRDAKVNCQLSPMKTESGIVFHYQEISAGKDLFEPGKKLISHRILL